MCRCANKDQKKEVRCNCGKLCFIRTKTGFEFKCNRCKRLHVLRCEDLMTHNSEEKKE